MNDFVDKAVAWTEIAIKNDEIARLRKALEEIVRANPVTGHLEVPQTKIARSALRGLSLTPAK